MKLKSYYYFLLFLIILIFTSIYIFSIYKIINAWTFTEAHINYSEGFVARGFFGTIMMSCNKFLKIPTIYFYSTFFYLFSVINTYLFFILIKDYSKNFFIFSFLALNPGLILFSFYDLGGYARFEIIAITSLLTHTYYVKKFNLGLIPIKKYIQLIKFIILPLITVCTLITDLMIFLIPFHLFLSHNILNEEKKFKNAIYLYIILIIPTYFVITNRINIELAKLMFEKLSDKNNLSFWILESISQSSVSRFGFELEYMGTKENIIRYFSIFLIFILPIYIFFYYLNIKKNIFVKNNFLSILSVAPIFILFFIARDWGRWIHIIIMTIFCYYVQFPLIKGIAQKNNNVKALNLKNIFLISFLSFYLFFIRIPHCCNLINLNITIYGGAFQKTMVLYDMIFLKKIEIDKRFKNFD